MPLDVLLSVGRFIGAGGSQYARRRRWRLHSPASHHDHPAHDPSTTFSSFCYESELPVSLEALREVVRQLPSEIYRAKGVIYTSDVPERRAVLQVVGKRVDISL